MAERGMGTDVRKHSNLHDALPIYAKEAAEVPVITKLTPNITDITVTARAAERGGADAISMINTINSLIGVDLDTWNTIPNVNGKGAHGCYSGPAVKPIALNMIGECARQQDINIPISGIGGVSTWQDTVEFMLMGAGGVQICTAAMHHGFSIIEDLTERLSNYLDDKGISSLNEIIGASVEKYTDWSNLDLNHKIVARINNDICINCNKCHIACEDTSHQCIDMLKDAQGNEYLEVREEDCVGCNLCSIVCPVDGAIDMVDLTPTEPPMSWNKRQSAIQMLNGNH